MAACVAVNQSGYFVLADPQPINLADCQSYVMMTPPEFSQATQVPDSAQAAEFFGFGFSMVVASYLAGWAVGTIRKTVRSGAN